MEMQEYFVITTMHKNCRKFFKRIYDLPVVVDLALAGELAEFGNLELLEFSKTVKGAKDIFQIRNSDGTEISGIIDDHSVYFVLPKKNSRAGSKVEVHLREYVRGKLIVK